jgi:3',5'-cyclic AMP phosphodiesterase CpdA
MHVSDLHAGPPFDQTIAAIMAEQAHELAPDLLVISGDLVQRATFLWEWHTIKKFLATLPQPRLVVAGNHDVPLFDGISRMLTPMRYYQWQISADLTPVFTRPGLAVVGGNSAHGLTADGGYVSRSQRQTMEQALAQFGPETCKVAVMHHPLIDPPVVPRKGRMRNADAMLALLMRCGVELYLSGHMHFVFVAEVDAQGTLLTNGVTDQQRLVICQSGTTTSRRGRGPDRRKNSFQVIRIDDTTIRIQPHFYEPTRLRFLPQEEQVFTRVGRGTTGEEQ